MLPNLVYIGPDKAGSTWLYHLLSHHDDGYVTPAKDIYFFDRYFDRGLNWYERQFEHGDGHKIVSEISHDYLYSRAAAERMANVLPDARLLVCLREPCERAFSGYLHLVKSGLFNGSFEEALDEFPGLLQRSEYGRHLAMYREMFPAEQIICTSFDDLRSDSQDYSDQLFSALGLRNICLPDSLQEQSLPAGQSRCVMLTKLVRFLAEMCRRAGMPKLVGRVKTSRILQRILFKCYTQQDKPTMSQATRARLRDYFQADVELLDQVMNTDMGSLWGYQPTFHEASLQRCCA